MSKYRPSNGTEGMDFMQDFCNRCSVEAICKIWPATMAHGIDDPKYPSQWIYGEDGEPTCTSFAERAAHRNAVPCKQTADLFEP